MDKLKIEDIAPGMLSEKQLGSLSLSADSVLTAFNTIIDALSSTTPSPSPTPETYTAGNGMQLSGN